MRAPIAIAALGALVILACPVVGHAQTPLDRARTLLSHGALDSAMAIVDSTLAADSADLKMWMVKAKIHARRSKRDEQIRALHALLDRYPMYPDALLALTRTYIDSGLADSAASYLKPNLLGRWPGQTEALYCKGRIFESRGQPDSAIAMYERAHDIFDRRVLLSFPPQRAERLSRADLYSPEGVPSVWRPGVPTIILFWAGWSSVSIDAFTDITENLKGAGISWRFVPINVDAPSSGQGKSSQAVNRARDLGYQDTVWVDRDLTNFRGWNIERVPTAVVVTINGEIDASFAGWSPEARSMIVDRYLGSYSDSVSEQASTGFTERSRARYLLATALQAGSSGNLEQAIKRSDKAVKTDPTFALAHASLAKWRWQRGDTLGARLAAYNAIAADPNDLWAMIAVARVEYFHGHARSAIDFARQCIVLDSGFVPALELLGHCAVSLGDTTTAQIAIDAIARFNKLDLELPVLKAHVSRATDPKAAAALLREAVAARL